MSSAKLVVDIHERKQTAFLRYPTLLQMIYPCLRCLLRHSSGHLSHATPILQPAVEGILASLSVVQARSSLISSLFIASAAVTVAPEWVRRFPCAQNVSRQLQPLLRNHIRVAIRPMALVKAALPTAP